MAKQKAVAEIAKEEYGDVSDVLKSHLKLNKDKHLNFEHKTYKGISSGSIILDMELGGSLKPGVHCMNGSSGGGKSSACLAFIEEFLKEPNRRAIYFQAERLLSDQHKARTSIVFSDSIEEWKDQTCFLYRGNVFEDVITCIRNMVNNSETTKFVFVIDSVNALIPEADLEKSFSDALKVAGGALLSSDFLRRMGLKLSVKGCYCFLIGQVRSAIKINPYEKVAPKLSNSSNGYAVDHYSEYVFEFQKAFSGDFIYKDATKKETLGKYAKVILRKSNGENNEGKTVAYPLKFGQKGKSSIWKEYEILNMLIAWQKFQKEKAWISPSEDLVKLLDDNNFSVPEKFQEKAMLDILEDNQDLTNFLFEKCKNLASNGIF